MECFGSTAVWDDDERLTIYDKTQGAQNSHRYMCNIFGLAKDKVRVAVALHRRRLRLRACGRNISCSWQRWPPSALKRSVRVTLTRQQMILGFGHRPGDDPDH